MNTIASTTRPSTCAPDHALGSKPQITPTGSADEAKAFVVRHGADYLDREGNVRTQGALGLLADFDGDALRMTIAEAQEAARLHEAAVAPSSAICPIHGAKCEAWS